MVKIKELALQQVATFCNILQHFGIFSKSCNKMGVFATFLQLLQHKNKT
jgi:hypothetical protein